MVLIFQRIFKHCYLGTLFRIFSSFPIPKIFPPNMADESSDNIWARKFLTLETRVKQIELVSCSNVLFFRILFFVEMYLTFNARKTLRLLSKFIEMFLLNS